MNVAKSVGIIRLNGLNVQSRAFRTSTMILSQLTKSQRELAARDRIRALKAREMEKEKKAKEVAQAKAQRERIKARKQKEKEIAQAKRARERERKQARLEREKVRKEALKAKAAEKKANKVPRAKSAFTFYVKEKYAEFAEPGVSATSIMPKIAEAWKTESNKEEYERLAAADKIRAAEQRAEVKAKQPQRPLSPYIRYMQQIRPTILQQSPEMPFAEVGAEIGRRWRALTPEQKSAYKDGN